MPESAAEKFPAEPLSLTQVARLMREAGCVHLYAKELSKNDDSKRQIYLTTDLSSFNMFPNRRQDDPDMPQGMIATRKPRKKKESNRIFGHLSMCWLGVDGDHCVVKDAKLIYYPQYPEVRLSGFLRGANNIPSAYLRERAGQHYPNRILFLGVTDAGGVTAFLAVGQDGLLAEVRALSGGDSDESVLQKLDLFEESESPRTILIARLGDIHRKGWIVGKKLSAEGPVPCNAPNAIGYTLEAELGISPNGDNSPDFCGWEVKAHTVSSFDSNASRVVTLFTPEPDVGVYADDGVLCFLRRWGYHDRSGRPDRQNFGGIYRVDQVHPRTGLRLTVTGYDRKASGRVDPDGVLALRDAEGTVAAGWTLAKLMDRWLRKHNATAYVPALARRHDGGKQFHFGTSVLLCEITRFELVLEALMDGSLYLDPAIKAEGWSTGNPKTKRRNQFRMKMADVGSLYEDSDFVDLR